MFGLRNANKEPLNESTGAKVRYPCNGCCCCGGAAGVGCTGFSGTVSTLTSVDIFLLSWNGFLVKWIEWIWSTMQTNVMQIKPNPKGSYVRVLPSYWNGGQKTSLINSPRRCQGERPRGCWEFITQQAGVMVARLGPNSRPIWQPYLHLCQIGRIANLATLAGVAGSRCSFRTALSWHFQDRFLDNIVCLRDASFFSLEGMFFTFSHITVAKVWYRYFTINTYLY